MNSHRDSEPSLEARLRSEARAMRATPPEGMEQRISAAVWREREANQTQPQREPRRRSFRLFSPTLAGLVTSACAIALVVLWHDRVEERRAREAADIRFLVDTVQTLPARLASTEIPVARTIAVAEPLAREFQSVQADARSALGFLAANFLPSDVLERSAPAGANEAQET